MLLLALAAEVLLCSEAKVLIPAQSAKFLNLAFEVAGTATVPGVNLLW